MLAVADRRDIIVRMIPDAANYVRVNTNQFVSALLNVKGAKIITLSALTVPQYRKTGCPYKNNIQKFARVNGFLNFDYERSVNNQREREDKTTDFESVPRSWGTHLTHTPFIAHINKATGKPQLYLKFKVQRCLSTAYYTLDGQAISEAEIEPFLPDKTKALRQGVDRDVLERDYAVENVTTVNINGQGYILA